MDESLGGLLAPVDDAAPGGAELDYDPAYVALEQEMEGAPEQQYGDVIIPARMPDWNRVATESGELLKRSKDFRLAVAHARALALTRGLEGAADGVELILALARNYWDTGYPALVFDGATDLLPRSNAIGALASRDGLLGDLRTLKLGSSSLGDLHVGPLERIASGRLGADEEAIISREELPHWLRDAAAAGNPQLLGLERLYRAVVELNAFCAEAFEHELAPDLAPLLGLLEHFAGPVAEGRNAAQVAAGGVEGEDATSGSALPAGMRPDPGAAYTRESVVQVLDAVCAYLRKAEPSNPAYLLIRRARNLIGKDFMAILEELAPDGIDSARKITGEDT